VVPLEEGDVVLSQQRVQPVADEGVAVGVGQVEDLLVAPGLGEPLGQPPRPPGPGQDPVGVGPEQVGVGVDHLRLDPQSELHAQLADLADQRVEAVGPDVGGDVPVAQPGGVVAAAAGPAVVEHEPLHPEAGGHLGQVGQPVQAVVEVDGLPGVEHHRSGGAGCWGRPRT
jgi:hypothetical protein